MSESEKVDSDGWQKWNLNDRVRVTLTTLGMRLLIEQDERLHIPQKEECLISQEMDRLAAAGVKVPRR
jgi:hypothetical protein